MGEGLIDALAPETPVSENGGSPSVSENEAPPESEIPVEVPPPNEPVEATE